MEIKTEKLNKRQRNILKGYLEYTEANTVRQLKSEIVKAVNFDISESEITTIKELKETARFLQDIVRILDTVKKDTCTTK